MRPIGEKRRRVQTLAGEIEFTRPVMECPRCRGSHAPVDVELGVKAGEHMTRRVVRRVAYAGAGSSFGQAANDLLELGGLHVSPAECARIANEIGGQVDELQREQEEKWSEPVCSDHTVAAPEIECECLVIEADSASVLTVKGEEHKMVHCGRAFGLESRGKTQGGRPVITESRYTTSALDYADFKHRLMGLANRMGARSAQETLFLADGAEPLWAMQEELFPGAIPIQDLWHVNERLSKLTKLLWAEKPQASEHYEKWKLALRESRMDDLLESLEDIKRTRRGDKRKAVEDEIAHLTRGRHRMDYAFYESQGWPIGSGPIEGTCKHLVKERFGKTGARWKRDNIKNVLALRQARFNNQWDSTWQLLAAA